MKKQFDYTTRGTCSRKIHVVIEDGVIENVTFEGGCAGNTRGVSALVQGMRVTEAIERLKGIRCGFKSTSCPDQLAQALEACVADE